MPASKPKDDVKRVMDVSKPGKAAPDPSSRPVIVGHRPMVADPMVNTENSDNPDATPEKKLEVTHEKVLLPPSQQKEEPMSDGGPAEDPAEPPAEDAAQQEAPAEEKASEATADDRPASNAEAVVDALAEQATAKKKDSEVSAEEKKQLEVINKLIEDKTYYVPVGQMSHRKAKHYLVACLVLIFLSISAAAVLDAGLIDVGVKLPFDYIKQ